jgi:hypothetical protein
MSRIVMVMCVDAACPSKGKLGTERKVRAL